MFPSLHRPQKGIRYKYIHIFVLLHVLVCIFLFFCEFLFFLCFILASHCIDSRKEAITFWLLFLVVGVSGMFFSFFVICYFGPQKGSRYVYILV